MCSIALCLPLLITAPNHRVWLSRPHLGPHFVVPRSFIPTIWHRNRTVPGWNRQSSRAISQMKNQLRDWLLGQPGAELEVKPKSSGKSSTCPTTCHVSQSPDCVCMGSGEPSWGGKKFSKGWGKARYQWSLKIIRLLTSGYMPLLAPGTEGTTSQGQTWSQSLL